MIPSPLNPPIALTEEQQKGYFTNKAEKFLAKLHEIEKETGMTIGAYLELGPNGVLPRMTVIPLKLGDKKLSREERRRQRG